MLPTYRRLLRSGIKMLVYSGDIDAIVPLTGSRRWTAGLKLDTIEPWRAWTSATKQVGMLFGMVRTSCQSSHFDCNTLLLTFPGGWLDGQVPKPDVRNGPGGRCEGRAGPGQRRAGSWFFLLWLHNSPQALKVPVGCAKRRPYGALYAARAELCAVQPLDTGQAPVRRAPQLCREPATGSACIFSWIFFHKCLP